MHLGSVELMGLQTNILYLKPISWNPLGSLMKYYLLFEKCFSVLLEYLLLKKSIACQILFYLKKGLDHHSRTKKTKKLRVLNSFSPTPSRRRECKGTSGWVPLRGYFCTPLFGGSPGSGRQCSIVFF